MTDGSSDFARELSAALEGHRLTPTQHRIAAYLEANPSEGATLDSVELASRVGVSQASVSRFAHAAGFEGYAPFRRWLRRFVAARRPEATKAGSTDRIADAVDDEIAALDALRSRFLEQRADLERAAHLLATSAALPIVGLRGSAALAHHVAFFAGRFHAHVTLVTTGDSVGLDTVRQSADAGATAALVIAVSRPARGTDAVMQLARDVGLDVVLLTNSSLHPLTEQASVVLPVGTSHKLMFDPMSAPMMLASLLLDAMTDIHPDVTRERLEAFEQAAQRHGYFLSPD